MKVKDSELRQLITQTDFRIDFINCICKTIKAEKESNWQQYRTPMEIVDKMISKTEVLGKIILVLFNVEFVERLIHEHYVLPENIFFFSDHKTEQLFVEEIYGVTSILGNKKLINEENKLSERILEMGQKEFDLAFSNPPYNNGVDLKILTAVEPLCKEMVVVHPSTWLLDLKYLKDLYINFKARIRNKLKSVEFFNGNPIFKIGLFVPCVITHISNTHNGNINVNYFGTDYKVDDIKNITKFGENWQTIVKPFMELIQEYTSKNGNVWQHNKLEIDSKRVHCQFAAIIGNHKKGSGLIKDDFYTLVIKDSENNKGIRQPNLKRPGNPTPTFEFNTETERDNFIVYCKTDFVRFCLALYKNGQNTSVGEMVLIPWVDFTQEWNDKKLYKFFKINEETQKYIEDFLPDYYGIREGRGME